MGSYIRVIYSKCVQGAMRTLPAPELGRDPHFLAQPQVGFRQRLRHLRLICLGSWWQQSGSSKIFGGRWHGPALE